MAAGEGEFVSLKRPNKPDAVNAAIRAFIGGDGRFRPSVQDEVRIIRVDWRPFAVAVATGSVLGSGHAFSSNLDADS